MKHLVVARTFNEPDNNTPSNEVWCKVVDVEPSEVAKYEKVFEKDFSGDYIEVELRPLAEFEDEWVQVSEVW